jgi:nicotinamide mononucleotide transporter
MLEWLTSNWTEIFGFVTGALCVFFAARRNIWTFPLGLASNVVFFVVFVEYALYADAGLQVVYAVLAVTGWIGWNRARADDHRAATRRLPPRLIPGLLVAAVAGTALLTFVLVTLTDSTTPVADAGTTTVSLVAQFMLNRRWIESWFVWISVDVAYIGLFLYKGLWITAALYVIFIALCVHGWLTWRRAPHEVVETEPVVIRA